MKSPDLRAALAPLLLAAILLPAGLSARQGDAPDPPQWISISARRETVGLVWVKDPRLAFVRVYRRAEGRGRGFSPIGETGANTYLDRNLEGGVTYHYRLVGVDSSGHESAPSRSRSVTIERSAARGVSPPLWDGYVLVEGGVGLKWSSRSEERVIAYNVYRREGRDGAYALLGSSGRTRFRDTSLEPGKEYFYVLTALGADFRESSRSTELAVVYAPEPERAVEEALEWKVRRTRLVRLVEREKADLAWPADVAVGGGSGNVYLSDSGTNRITLFNRDGGLLTTLGEGVQGSSPIGKLTGFALDGEENIYAVDSRDGTVTVMGSDGSVRNRIVLPRAGWGERGPVDVASMGGDRLFVVDNASSAVTVLEGADPVRTFGGPGFEPGKLSAPTFCTTDGEGRFLLSDTMNGRVQIFDSSGEFLRSFGEYGEGLGKLARPKGIAVSARGEIYVADSWLNVIQVFDGQGKFLALLADEEGELLDLGSPNGIALGGGNRIYIAERLAGRLQVREILDE